MINAKIPDDLKKEILESYENLNVEEKDLEKGALKVLDKKIPFMWLFVQVQQQKI